MLYDPTLTRSEGIDYAIEQAREGAMAVEIPAYVYDMGQNKFLVNSQLDYDGREPMCHVLPNLDVIWHN